MSPHRRQESQQTADTECEQCHFAEPVQLQSQQCHGWLVPGLQERLKDQSLAQREDKTNFAFLCLHQALSDAFIQAKPCQTVLQAESASWTCKKKAGQGMAATWNRKGKSNEQGRPDWSCRASPESCADGHPGVALTCQHSPAGSDLPLVCSSGRTCNRDRLPST